MYKMSQQAPSGGDQVRSLFREWAQLTGWHGVLDFVYARNFFLRVIWALVLVGGTFLAINQSCILLSDFMLETRWTTSVTYEYPEDGILDWPNFTLCNLNWLGKSKLEEKGLVQDPYAVEYAANRDDGVEFFRDMQDKDRIVESATYKEFVYGRNGSSIRSVSHL